MAQEMTEKVSTTSLASDKENRGQQRRPRIRELEKWMLRSKKEMTGGAGAAHRNY